ncbi:winged helix-turn-helix transcriptional regulator [Mesorhizobium sp. M1143]|uniref:winged helix-turn-helix transcriptional regulator n=1 Tax=Mesorhizobium sp. M1143 TaxID=2957061 RepID=UPI003335658B
MQACKARLGDFDIKILQLVPFDDLIQQREISDRVGLSAAAVARRLKGLRSTGIIRKDISVLSERAVGRPQRSSSR